MDNKPPRHNDQLGVKKIGKKIKKTPLHLPTLPNGCTSKNRFTRSIVPPHLTSALNRPHHVPPPAMARDLARPPMMGHADKFWSNIAAESSLQSSSGDSGPSARFSGGGGGLLPTPASPQSSFGDSGPPNRNPSHDYQQQPPPPRFYGSVSSVPILPSPRFDGPGLLPTPPRVQYPSPLQPRTFASSSLAQGGILGPGKFPRP